MGHSNAGDVFRTRTEKQKDGFDYLKVFDDYLEELAKSVETLGHA